MTINGFEATQFSDIWCRYHDQYSNNFGFSISANHFPFSTRNSANFNLSGLFKFLQDIFILCNYMLIKIDSIENVLFFASLIWKMWRVFHLNGLECLHHKGFEVYFFQLSFFIFLPEIILSSFFLSTQCDLLSQMFFSLSLFEIDYYELILLEKEFSM